jgi:hypothetical protein
VGVAERRICRGSLLVRHDRASFQPQRVEPAYVPGRRVYQSAISATIVWRGRAIDLKREMQRPSAGPWSRVTCFVAVPNLRLVPGAFPFLDQLPKTGALF